MNALWHDTKVLTAESETDETLEINTFATGHARAFERLIRILKSTFKSANINA